MERSRLLAVAQAERARLGRTIQYAAPESWDAASPCEDWRNRDVLAHLAAQEIAAVQVVRGGEAEEFAAFRDANGGDFWVDGFNEFAVRLRADHPTRSVLEDWGRAADLLLDDLARIPAADWNGLRVPWVAGEIGVRYLVQSRIVEWWLHGEDVREGSDLERNPQQDAVFLVNDMAVRMLPWALGRAERSFPGRTVRVDLDGVGGGTWTWALAARETPDPDRKPDAFIQGRATAFASVAGRRLSAGAFLDAGDLVLGGDEEIALTVLELLRAFVD
ncbi:MAG: maleylpyruvate isomerase family mycothiol-dependent enzyme [Actinomycetota bacterium]